MAAAERYWHTQGARLATLQQEKLSSLEASVAISCRVISREGFETKGTINLETLSPEGDFGRLDGLEYKSRDGRTKILVTTTLTRERLARQVLSAANKRGSRLGRGAIDRITAVSDAGMGESKINISRWLTDSL